MTITIGRRKFIAALGGAAATWPLAAHAQQRMPVIGYLGLNSAQDAVANLVSFRQGLREVGYVEGQNVTIAHESPHFQMAP